MRICTVRRDYGTSLGQNTARPKDFWIKKAEPEGAGFGAIRPAPFGSKFGQQDIGSNALEPDG